MGSASNSNAQSSGDAKIQFRIAKPTFDEEIQSDVNTE